MQFTGYVEELAGILKRIEYSTTDAMPLEEGVVAVLEEIREVVRNNKKIFFVGNGGSAAIASHSAADFFRTAGIKSQCFSDASLLTCMGNDFGYPEVFSRPLQKYLEAGDLLIAVSSSGQSVNILNAVEAAQLGGGKVITLSGFKADNPLRQIGEYNFYVPANQYGYIELAHGVLCHSFLDCYMKNNERKE